MKKIISAFLALTMIVAMVAAISVSSSAADANALIRTYAEAQNGDKLIGLVFGETTGAYQPIIFANSDNEKIHAGVRYHADPVVTVAEDKKSFNLFYGDAPEGTNANDCYGNLMYGGKIDGLKWGVDADGNPYQYTFVFKARFDETDSNNRQSGFYFSLGSNLTSFKDEAGRTIVQIEGQSASGHTGAFGYWGHPYNSVGDTKMRWHRIDKDGCTDKNLDGTATSQAFRDAMKAGVGEWYDVVVEIDGYKMNVSFNGNELGLGKEKESQFYDFSANAAKDGATSHDLAFITRLYNATMNFGVKDVNVYKGIDITSFNDAPPATETPDTGDAAVYFVVVAVVSVLGVAMVAKKRSHN